MEGILRWWELIDILLGGMTDVATLFTAWVILRCMKGERTNARPVGNSKSWTELESNTQHVITI